jgi:hypothetical protein
VGKKKKNKKTKPEKSSKIAKNTVIGILAILVIALVAVAYQLKSTSDKNDGSVSAVSVVDETSLLRGETRPTLSPALFSDTYIAETYRIAQEIPNVLDSLYCYCYCDKDPFYHVSLLSCYVDKHAAG